MTVEGHRPINGWWAYWVLITCAVAAAVTVIDAALLQRKWNYFTGGFLAVEHVRSVPQAFGFAVASLVADGATASLVVALVLSITLWLHLPRVQIVLITLFLALCPFAVANIVGYSILSFLGDNFDLQLMFDLSGRNAWEFLAVTQGHLANAAWIGVPAVAVFIWLGVVAARRVAKRLSQATVGLTPPHFFRAVTAVAILLLFASASTVGFRLSSDDLDAGLKRKPSIQALSTSISWLSDVDGDGYGVLGQIDDPAPFNGKVFPYALDIPGDGVDQDGVAGDYPGDLANYTEDNARVESWAFRPNVVVVMLESVRNDAVGSTLDGRAVTPVMDALAQTGVRVSRAYSHNGYTVQSRQHVFSGSLAGLRHSSIIDDFKANGYQVAYFSAQDESFGGTAGDVGFARADVSFDARSDMARRYSASTTPGSLALPYHVLLEHVTQFLEDRRDDRPLFLYVNFHDTHFPYHHNFIQPRISSTILQPREIAPALASQLRSVYLNTLANVDHAIGSLLEDVRHRLGSDPAVIVLSDHGESLFDEGFLGHGYDLTEAQTRIPLIISGLPAVVAEPFGQSDLRDVIRVSLARASKNSFGPRVVTLKQKEVFQYIGIIDHPVQIGLRGERTVAYDFRRRRVRLDGGPWVKPEMLEREDQTTFNRLVHRWESLMLARAGIPSQNH